jgi:hypothetical protein
MTERSGLFGGAIDRNGNIAEHPVAAGIGKRKHIGGIVVAEKIAVELFEARVPSEQAVECGVGHLLLEAGMEQPQTPPVNPAGASFK